MVKIIEGITELQKEKEVEQAPTEKELQAKLTLRKSAKQSLILTDPELSLSLKGKAKVEDELEKTEVEPKVMEGLEEDSDADIDLEANHDVKYHLNKICSRMDKIWNATRKKQAENKTLHGILKTSENMITEQNQRMEEYVVQVATVES